MRQRNVVYLCVLSLCFACSSKPTQKSKDEFIPPDWRIYRAPAVEADDGATAVSLSDSRDDSDRFTFRDLKTENDASLARRLLGAAGKRVVFIDRHRQRWRYYSSDADPAQSIDLYTHPDALGSQYGLCGVEKYSVTFDDKGHVAEVSAAPHYGIEGPIFQKKNFDWNYYYHAMCAAVPATHAPSYFPAPDSIQADEAAALLVAAIDLARSSKRLPYRLECRNWDGSQCAQDTRKYLATLRLEDIDEFSRVNCPLGGGNKAVCFTVETGQNRLGPFPKSITLKGSTYMNDIRVDSVAVYQGSTMS